MTITIVTENASKSPNGNDNHTPVTPKNSGNISISGIMKITWRVRLRNIALPEAPMLWNKQVATMGTPTNENAHVALWRQCTVTSIR